MKSVLMLCVVIGTCLSVPLLNSQSPAIKTTKHAMIKNMRTRNVIKRNMSHLDSEIEAFCFRLIDINLDGHITDFEWATYYSGTDIPGIPKFGYSEWIYAFRTQMNSPDTPDTNNNGKLELPEFRSMGNKSKDSSP